jgi:hypothetical protein
MSDLAVIWLSPCPGRPVCWEPCLLLGSFWERHIIWTRLTSNQIYTWDKYALTAGRFQSYLCVQFPCRNYLPRVIPQRIHCPTLYRSQLRSLAFSKVAGDGLTPLGSPWIQLPSRCSACSHHKLPRQDRGSFGSLRYRPASRSPWC